MQHFWNAWVYSVLSKSFVHGDLVWIGKEQKMQDLASRKHWSRSHRVVEHPWESRAQPRLQNCRRLDLQHALQGSFLWCCFTYGLLGRGNEVFTYRATPTMHLFFSAGPFLKLEIHTCHKERLGCLTVQLQKTFLSRRLRVNPENETKCIYPIPNWMLFIKRFFPNCSNSSKTAVC